MDVANPLAAISRQSGCMTQIPNANELSASSWGRLATRFQGSMGLKSCCHVLLAGDVVALQLKRSAEANRAGFPTQVRPIQCSWNIRSSTVSFVLRYGTIKAYSWIGDGYLVVGVPRLFVAVLWS